LAKTDREASSSEVNFAAANYSKASSQTLVGILCMAQELFFRIDGLADSTTCGDSKSTETLKARYLLVAQDRLHQETWDLLSTGFSIGKRLKCEKTHFKGMV